MNLEILTALIVFSFVASITPGPNNLMLMSSGANFGFKRTLPHVLGVSIGFTFMVLLVGLGVMQLFELVPASYGILKVLSVIYLLYLAYKIAMTKSQINEDASEKGEPLSFIQAALFQWVNPKAWTMSLTAISAYAPTQSLAAVLLVTAVFGLVNFPCVSSWIVLGQKMRLLLTSERRMRGFNYAMATLLILSLYPVVL